MRDMLSPSAVLMGAGLEDSVALIEEGGLIAIDLDTEELQSLVLTIKNGDDRIGRFR